MDTKTKTRKNWKFFVHQKSERFLSVLPGILLIIILLISGCWILENHIRQEPIPISGTPQLKEQSRITNCNLNSDCICCDVIKDRNYEKICANKNYMEENNFGCLLAESPYAFCMTHQCKCENNKCTAVEKSTQDVTLTTDKTEYERGDTVKITLKNNLDKPVFYLAGLTYCSTKPYEVYQFFHVQGEEKWLKVMLSPSKCAQVEGAGLPIYTELNAGESIEFTWNPGIWGTTHKISMKYKKSKNIEDLKEIYSNEFTIKEKASDKYKIHLKSRQFVPEPGISDTLKSNLTTTSPKQMHVLLQFYHTPNNNERSELSNLNVTLCGYIPNNAYFASIPTVYLTEIFNLSFIRWIGDILPEDKLSPYIREGKIGDWAINEDGNVCLTILFFKDVSLDKAEQLIESYDGTVNGKAESINALVVAVPQDALMELAKEDSVHWIEQVSPPGTDDITDEESK